MKTVKHYDAIIQIFKALYEPWMSDTDKEGLVIEIMSSQGMTLQMLSDEIDVGVGSGYTVEQQIEIAQLVIDIGA